MIIEKYSKYFELVKVLNQTLEKYSFLFFLMRTGYLAKLVD